MVMKGLSIFIPVIMMAFSAVVSCTMPTIGYGSVEGIVTLSSSGEPVEGVLVCYGSFQKYTDELGRYSFEDIPEGLQGIIFSKTGFVKVVSQVEIIRDGTIENNVTMSVMSNGWSVGAVDTEYGSIFYTEDGGSTWIRQGSYSVIPPNDLFCVCAVNAKCCWVAGDTTFNVVRNRMEYSILKTSDAGTTWRRQGQTIGSTAPYPVVGITAVDTSDVLAVTDANIVLKGTKGGESWSLCYSSEHVPSFRAISTCDGIHIWAGGSAVEGGNAGLEYSSDSGSKWTFIIIPDITDKDTITSISAVDSNMVYVSGSFGMCLTRDHGLSWTKVLDASPYSVSTVCSLGSFCGWAAPSDGTLLYSTDSFGTYSSAQITAPVKDISITAISFLGDIRNGALSYKTSDAAVPGGILYTNDGGKSWIEAVTPYKVALSEISLAGTRH